jgi:hypothetical protein
MSSEQGSQHGEAANQDAHGGRSRWWLLLLLRPYVGLLYPPIYSRLDPELWGIPFFIWYQFLWVLITVVITAVVYRVRS